MYEIIRLSMENKHGVGVKRKSMGDSATLKGRWWKKVIQGCQLTLGKTPLLRRKTHCQVFWKKADRHERPNDTIFGTQCVGLRGV